MKNYPESRNYGRKPLHQSVSFELSEMESDRVGNVVQQGLGVDLSPGGLGLVTGYPLSAGEVVRVFLPMAEGERRLPVFTEVVWSAQANGEYRAGLIFIRSENRQDRLEDRQSQST